MDVMIPHPELAPARAAVHRSSDPEFNPWTILVDTAEQHAFTFQSIYADADRGGRELVVSQGVNLVRQCLGRHPNSLGDYSIQGFVGRCHVERKSLEDAHGTILGFTKTIDGQPVSDRGRRERFERELLNLSNIEAGCIVVECSLGELLDKAPEYELGKKTGLCNRKILSRSIIAWQQDYPVHWIFCDSRRHAEMATFRWLERFWKKHKPKRASKRA